MTPVYFPFTYITAAGLKVLQTCFQSVVVYQPSGLNIPQNLLKGKESGLIDLRIPIQSEEDKLDRLLKEFENWAAIHQQKQMDVLKARGEKIPFFEEFSASRIRSAIKKDGAEAVADPLFNARLFLQIAQEFDLYQDELNREMVLLDKAEQDIYKGLKGEVRLHNEKHSGPNTTAVNQKTDYMAFQRLIAWTHLFRYERGDAGNDHRGLFITTSRAVLELLIESRSENVKKLLCCQNIPVEAKEDQDTRRWPDYLSRLLNELAEGGGNGSAAENVCLAENDEIGSKAELTVYMVPEETPLNLLLTVTGIPKPAAGNENIGAGAGNTLLGIMEMCL